MVGFSAILSRVMNLFIVREGFYGESGRAYEQMCSTVETDQDIKNNMQSQASPTTSPSSVLRSSNVK